MALAGISRDGSSDSDSSGAGVAAFDGGAIAGEYVGRGTPLSATGAVTGWGATISGAAGSVFFGGSTGVSSTVECLPVVQGGISRNSSKVRTRGLQHFQPVDHARVNVGGSHRREGRKCHATNPRGHRRHQGP